MGFALKKDERYTVADYLAWPEDTPRCELIDGVVYDMAAPSVEHQELVGGLYFALETYRRESSTQGGGFSCMVLLSPVDVILSEFSVVQPDLVVLCSPAKVRNGRIHGAPDLVVEVLSPSSAAKDRKHKRRLYELAGVPQYLLIDPAYRYAELFSLGTDGRYPESDMLLSDNTLTLQVAPGFSITLANLFGWPLPLEVRQEIVSYQY